MSRTINHATKYSRKHWPTWKHYRVRACPSDCRACDRHKRKARRNSERTDALTEARTSVE